MFTSPIIYVEIGHSSLKLRDGNDGLELSLARLDSGRLTPLCVEAITDSLRVFLKKHSWRPRLQAFCAIGARGVSLRRLTLPASSNEDLSRLLLLQVEREFPLAPEDMAWGSCRVDPVGTKSGEQMLVVAVKREVIEEYSEMLAACRLNLVFTLGAWAGSRLCHQPPPTYAFLDLGRTHSELITFDQGAPDALRILPWGGESLTQSIENRMAIPRPEAEKLKIQWSEGLLSSPELREKFLDILKEELQTLAHLIGKMGKKVYLTGATALLPGVSAQLAAMLGPGVVCERIEFKPGEGSSAAIHGLQRSVAQNEGALPLVLQPPTVRAREKQSAQPVQWKWAAVAAFLLVISLSLRYAEAFLQKPALTKKLSELKAYRASLPGVERELSFLQYLKTNQPPYLASIHALANSAAPGTRLETLSLNRRGDMALRAAMRDGQQVVDLRSKLIGSGLYSVVVVDEQTPSADRQKVSVRMTGQWKQPPAEKNSPGESREVPAAPPGLPGTDGNLSTIENRPSPPAKHPSQ